MLIAAEALLRELPSASERSEVELIGAVRMPIAWPKTIRRQQSTGDETRFVCRPAERRFDTALARLVRLALTRCVALTELAEETAGAATRADSVGLLIRERRAKARRLLRHTKLAEVRLVEAFPEPILRSLETRAGAGELVAFLRTVREGLEGLDPRIVQATVGTQLLAPSTDDRLFELVIGFQIVESLEALGFVSAPGRLIAGAAVPFVRMRHGHRLLTMWWQRPLWSVGWDRANSRFRRALSDARIEPLSSLRPDFLVVLTQPLRLLMVEVKHTSLPGAAAERQAVLELLAYVKDAEVILDSLPAPHGLAVAWNATGIPASSRVVVSSQETSAQAVAIIINSWAIG